MASWETTTRQNTPWLTALQRQRPPSTSWARTSGAGGGLTQKKTNNREKHLLLQLKWAISLQCATWAVQGGKTAKSATFSLPEPWIETRYKTNRSSLEAMEKHKTKPCIWGTMVVLYLRLPCVLHSKCVLNPLNKHEISHWLLPRRHRSVGTTTWFSQPPARTQPSRGFW